MLFRPKFCCNCGEQIERTDWKLWTSRSFCDLCATDFSIQELIPKAVVVLAAVISVFGVANYFSGGPARSNLATSKFIERSQAQNRTAEKGNSNTAAPASQTTPGDSTQLPQHQLLAGDRAASRTFASTPSPKPGGHAIPELTGPVYICGAETKKGTPCTRRVKGNVRCWQHAGMPAMMPPEKLLVSR